MFDFTEARNRGTDKEIVDYLSQKEGETFDFTEARKRGTDKEIVDYLSQKEGETPTTAQTQDYSTPEYTEGMDTKATMTPQNLDLVADTKKRNEVFLMGAEATGQGVLQTGYDFLGLFTDEFDSLSEENQQTIKTLNQEIETIEKNLGTSDDFFSSSNVGRFMPALATLPIVVKTKTAAFLLEGAIGYAEARGNDQSITSSLISGTFAGLFTVGGMKLFDMLSTSTATKVYDYLKDYNNITDSEADNIFMSWSKTADVEDTPANRAKAIVDKLGFKGAGIKQEAAAGSPSAVKAIEGEIKLRRSSAEDLTKGASKIDHTAEAIHEASEIIKTNYNEVKAKIVNKPVNIELSIPEALDEATTGDIRALQEVFDKEYISVDDLVGAMPHVNSLLRKTKGTTKHTWGIVKNDIDKGLKESLSPSEYKVWSKANADYSQMSNVTNSTIGKIITKVKAGSVTPELGIKQIKLLSGGPDLFTDIEFMIGSQKTASFEKAILKEAFGKNSEYVDWAHLARNLDTKGFTTKVGKNLKTVIDDMAESFMTDDAIQAIIFRNQSLSAGMSDSFFSKIHFSLIHKLFNAGVNRLPLESSRHMLRMGQLGDILSNPMKLKNLTVKIKELNPGVKDRLVENIVQEMLPQIEFIPRGPDKLYATLKGTIAKNPSVATLSEAQEEILKNYFKSPLVSERVIPEVKKIMDTHRVLNRLKQLNTKMKINDIESNKQMLIKIVTKEAEDLVKFINKTTGVNLPKEEAEKIIKLKIADLLKECE